MRALLSKPVVRLALRAVFAGAAVFVAKLQSADALDLSILAAAATAAGWTALEAFTPLNSLVGYFKS